MTVKMIIEDSIEGRMLKVQERKMALAKLALDTKINKQELLDRRMEDLKVRHSSGTLTQTKFLEDSILKRICLLTYNHLKMHPLRPASKAIVEITLTFVPCWSDRR